MKSTPSETTALEILLSLANDIINISMLKAVVFQSSHFKVGRHFCASLTLVSLAILTRVRTQSMSALSKCYFLFFIFINLAAPKTGTKSTSQRRLFTRSRRFQFIWSSFRIFPVGTSVNLITKLFTHFIVK